MIRSYARRKQLGFSYKEYPDLPEEVWKRIEKYENKIGRWEISNMNRVKYITNHAENVLYGERLCLDNNGYPIVGINGKKRTCHTLSFMAFFPEEYSSKRTDEMILHEDDDRNDFRPHKLRLGTHSNNGIDAHENGKYYNTKSERMKCASYIDNVLEKEHISQVDAVNHLKSLGFQKADSSKISKALKLFVDGKTSIRYGRTWKPI